MIKTTTPSIGQLMKHVKYLDMACTGQTYWT